MPEPSREEIDRISGRLVLEFGASWCPHCRAIQATMSSLLSRLSEVKHLRIEDGPGQPLGRSFGVKLWPTLVFLRDGQVLSKLVRPSPEEITREFTEGMRGEPAGSSED